ncbi:MAG: histidine--tRNA ligase [Anaerolineaceae bacterium]|nr:histidine--tRNA ligase [Anaerolineaceae bacterium]
MPKIEPRLPKGMRDFLPADMLKREYVFSVVKEVFHLYGFEPIQTPVLELSETLLGKYGQDAENLIFKVQHSRSSKEPLAMRYDLTVPLARVVALHENQLTLPFKRYHMAPVWRGERPQRGRYREFYQCDADIVGVPDMSADAEIIGVVVTALKRLNFPQFTVKVNNRKLLTGMGVYSGVPENQLAELYRSVDKFDKIGADGVEKELKSHQIEPEVVNRMMHLIQIKDGGLESLNALESKMQDIPIAVEGISELRQLAEALDHAYISLEHFEFDFTMVRGLGYYTGPIFETVITDPNLGSVTGGGRYDNLIGLFRRESLPTTGTSLGIERMIDVMDLLNLYPAELNRTVVEVLVTIFDEKGKAEATRLAAELRASGVATEFYMNGQTRLGKQIGYADRKGIPLVAFIGPDEIAAGQVKLKHMGNGDEYIINRDVVASKVYELLQKQPVRESAR